MSPDAQSEDTHEVSGSESVGERENGKGSSERKFTSTLWQLGMWLCVHCTWCVCVLSGGMCECVCVYMRACMRWGRGGQHSLSLFFRLLDKFLKHAIQL